MTNTFTCAMCGGTFERNRSDQEAMEETRAIFGDDVTLEECDLVCDGCWQSIHPDRNQTAFVLWKEERK